jgi:hypothetical protein
MITFEEWWEDLVSLSEDRGFELNIENPEEYREYYDDGDTPEDTLIQELGW